MEIKIDERELFRALAQYSTDFRKIEYLENILEKNLPYEIRKLTCQLLGDLRKKHNYFNTAAKHYNEVAELAKVFGEKINFYMLAAEMFIKAGDFFSADDFYRKSLVIEKQSEKGNLKTKMLSLYLERAEHFEKINRLRNAINTYQKILTYKPEINDANKIRDRIAVLYERSGNLKEANHIRSLKQAAIQAEKEKTEIEFSEKAQESTSEEKFVDF
jgi:tetratricopeptide (TPR) repeat protein